jgi:LPXTG-motif cell wall-anchored protein
MSTPTASQALRPAVAIHTQDLGLINVGGSGLNGNSAATGSTASGLPNFGGLQWQPTKLNTRDTGYTAPDNAGGWYYFGPDNVLYHNSYPGEVRASDVSTSAVGSVQSYFGGTNAGAPSAGASAPTDPFATLAQTFQSLANAGAPTVASAPQSTQAQVVPTQSGGGANLLIPVLVLLLAGGAAWYFYFRKKK